jgi:hypothetical protein
MKTPTINSRILKLEVLNGTATRTSVNAVESRTTSLESDVSTLQGNVATLTQGIQDAVSTHNTATDSHADIRADLASAVSAHNAATDSHADLRTAIARNADHAALSNVLPSPASQNHLTDDELEFFGTLPSTISDLMSNVEEVDADFVSISYNPSSAGGGGTVFSPDALSGLKAWFKADSGVLKTDGSTAGDGDSVAIWQDQSGGGFHLAQGDGAKQPVLTPSAIGAHAALRFDAVSRYMLTTTGPSMDLSELTIAVVFRSLSSEKWQRLVVLGPTGTTGADWNSPNRCKVSLADEGDCVDFYANSQRVTIAGSRPPPPGVLIARISRGRMVLIADDVVRSSVASVSSLSTSVGLLLGADYNSGSIGPSSGLDGYIAELTLFSRALSDFECGQLSNYLARWLR